MCIHSVKVSSLSVRLHFHTLKKKLYHFRFVQKSVQIPSTRGDQMYTCLLKFVRDTLTLVNVRNSEQWVPRRAQCCEIISKVVFLSAVMMNEQEMHAFIVQRVIIVIVTVFNMQRF